MQTFDLTPFVEFSTFFKTHQNLLSPPPNEHIFCLAFVFYSHSQYLFARTKEKVKAKLAVKKVSFFRHPLVTDEL